jgi:esterase/lipase superfamily enzyme
MGADMPSQPDLRVLLDTLDNDDFLDLCQTHFPAVYGKFAPGMTRPHHTRLLLEYVTRRGEAERLLALLPKPAAPLSPPPPAPPPVQKCDVLVLAANPSRTPQLDLDAEAKLIRERLGEGEVGRRLSVCAERAVRAEDLSRLLLQYDPVILQFSGHGSPDGDILLEGLGGTPQPVPPEALARMVAAVRGRLECVVLNACFSLVRGESLAEKVRCVIGTSRAFDDASAARFAAGFYRGLAFGKGYLSAFELGRAEVATLRLPDEDVPRLLSRDPEILDPAGGPGRMDRTPPVAALPATGGWWYPLWYGTHRRPNDAADPLEGYSSDRDGTVHYGACRVAIPRSHRVGTLGTSWWQRLLASQDPLLRLDRASLRTFADVAGFWADVGHTLGQIDVGERSALVFIHGYNVSFEEAALRAAQIGFDLQVPGITAFYSWPSRGQFTGYLADEATIGASHTWLAEFLTGFVRHSGAEQVHLIAHSMGNRALLRCLRGVIDAVGGTVPFGQIFLAAPDVDAEEFLLESAVYRGAAKRTTLYASSRDRALASSGILHGGYPRAGYAPPITVVDGLDTVEVTNVDLSWLGHGYYADARDLLHDMHAVLLHDDPPEKRHGLRASA